MGRRRKLRESETVDDIAFEDGEAVYEAGEPSSSKPDDANRFVLRYCAKYAPLSREQELKAFKDLRSGVQTSKDRALRFLLKHNQRLVADISFRYLGRGLDLEDLMQAGNIGLLKAANKFDPERGFKFSTMATWWIREGIQRALKYTADTVHMSVLVREDRTKIQKERNKGWQEEGIDLTPEQLAERTGMDSEYIRSHWIHLFGPRALDSSPTNHPNWLFNFSTFADIQEDKNLEPIIDQAKREEDSRWLRVLLMQIPPKDAEFISRKYGIPDNTPRTRSQMAEIFNISETRVSIEEKRIMKRLRELAKREDFNDLS